VSFSDEERAELIAALTKRRWSPTGCVKMLNDDGVRRLAIAVLQQVVADLHSGIPE
jgi:hypothetical protein